MRKTLLETTIIGVDQVHFFGLRPKIYIITLFTKLHYILLPELGPPSGRTLAPPGPEVRPRTAPSPRK